MPASPVPLFAVVSVMPNISPAVPVPGGEEIVVITRSGSDPIVMVPADAVQLLFSSLSSICEKRPPLPGPASAHPTKKYAPGARSWNRRGSVDHLVHAGR